MNDIIMTDDKIDSLVADMGKRASQLSTPEGKEAAQDEMIKLLSQLMAAGYRLPQGLDRAFMARTWAAQLSGFITIYGFRVLRRAVAEFINTDSREYKGFPTVSDITEVMKRIGINPKAEKAKKDKADREAELERQWAEEKRKYHEQNPAELTEERKAITKRLYGL